MCQETGIMKNTLLLAWLTLAPLACASTGYLAHNLVASPGGTADFSDSNLVAPWGIGSSATGPFWVCNAGTGLATGYTANATGFSVESTVVGIPALRLRSAHGIDYTRTI